MKTYPVRCLTETLPAMKVYSVRSIPSGATTYFTALDKALAYMSRNGLGKLTGEITECTEQRIGTEYEWKVVVKYDAPEPGSIYACFGGQPDDVYMVAGHDVIISD